MFYICASIGAIATAISLIYLFIKDYKKNKRISNLERVAEVLEKDLNLRYQPHLWINGVYMKKTENRINFNINNKREWCRLLKFEIISGDLELDDLNLHLPWELEPKFNENIGNDTTSSLIFTKNSSHEIALRNLTVSEELRPCDGSITVITAVPALPVTKGFGGSGV